MMFFQFFVLTRLEILSRPKALKIIQRIPKNSKGLQLLEAHQRVLKDSKGFRGSKGIPKDSKGFQKAKKTNDLIPKATFSTYSKKPTCPPSTHNFDESKN